MKNIIEHWSLIVMQVSKLDWGEQYEYNFVVVSQSYNYNPHRMLPFAICLSLNTLALQGRFAFCTST